MINNKSYSFLAIGKTQKSVGYNRYVGVGSSFVLAVNPTKKELEGYYGREIANEPEYVVDTDNGKEARITFIVKTDPAVCNGIEIINRVMFTLRNAAAYSQDKTSVQVIDKYGNSTWADVETVKEGKQILDRNGNPKKIAPEYRIACVGEADLVEFLKYYLGVQDAFNYVSSTWVLKEGNLDDYLFGLEHIKDYFTGDFSELQEALKLQPNNKIKLLYGIRTTDEGKQYQAVATRQGLMLPNYSGSKGLQRMEKELARIKGNGGYASIEFKVQELAEYNVEGTNLNNAPAADTSEDDGFPWN